MASEFDKALCKNCRLEFSAQALFCPNCGTAKSRKEDGGDPILGTTIGGRYLLTEQVGQGGSGNIYRAEHVTLRRRVAVKVLHHELSRDDLAIERFRREATTVGDLENDHIVEIYDFGRTDDGRLYLAMEYLEGETLADILERDGRLPTDLVVDILTQLGEALIEAHAMGYVHRDLRPRNIFLAMRRTRANYVKLLDFGLAKLVEREGEAASTSLGMTFGDPHYMSPEQAKGEPVDRRADIYSLGCIAYQMLTGEPPFHGGKVFDVLTRQVDEAPAPLAAHGVDVPPWLERAIMRCLAKKPDERFITVYRLVEALRQGTDSGVIMTDEVARQQETEMPASVSRAMAKLGARSPELEGPDPALEGGPAQDFEEPAAVPSQTVLGMGGQASAAAVKARIEHRKEPSKSAAPKGKSDRNAESSTGLSAAWYADGDESFEGGDVLSEGAHKKLDRARGNSPSRTGLMSAHDDELYEDDFVEPSRVKYWVGGILGLGLVATAAVLFWPSKDASTSSAAETSQAATDVNAAPEPSPVPSPEPSLVAEARDAAAVEASPENPAPTGSDSEPVDPKVAKVEPKPQEPKPRDPKPRDPKPRNPKPQDNLSRIDIDLGDRKPDPEPDPEPDPPSSAGSEDAKQAEHLATLGQRDFDAGDILGAATNFNKARALDPKNAAAVAGLGEIALSQGAYPAAVGHLKKAAALNPRSARIHTLLGEAYLGSGQNAQAASAFKNALKRDPDNARARNGYNEATGNL